MVLELISLYPDASKRDFSPTFLVTSTNLSPNFAITLFSSIRGTMSDIVPMHTISKYFKYSFSGKSSFFPIA